MMDGLAAASSLMSSRWSRDNLVTGHPARLYNGRVVERIGREELEQLIAALQERRGPFEVGAARMGVYTWDLACADEDGAFVLQVPLVLDERGRRDRAKRDVPRLNVENMRDFAARGLGRFVLEPRELLTMPGDVPVAIFGGLPDHHPILFGRGSLQIELAEDPLSWLIGLGPAPTAELLAEMVAALVYHYDPDSAGGTALTDVFINDGDFVARRRPDGGFDVRLTAARRREGGIGPSLLLLYLVQMMAYEDWQVGDNFVGLPVLVGNPSVAFEGVVRGLRHRYRDLGRSEEAGVQEAQRWIRDFSRSREGRAYRPWAERFLAGRLPLGFGDDPRDRWWQLLPLHTQLGVLELRAKQDPHSEHVTAARNLGTFIERLSREIGRVPENEAGMSAINDLGRGGLLALLEEADAQLLPDARARLADELLARWPYRGLDHLLAQVPGARALRRLKSRISFGAVVPDDEQGTLKSLGPPPKHGGAGRPLANPELFGGVSLPPSLHAAAARTFPTFEAYMDAALHDPTWGYYANSVLIGSTGHFNTNPEDLSPHYGRWLATWAFRVWREMVARGEVADTDPFPIIEFGAGNGRLARDFLDAVAQSAQREVEGWRTFATRLDYRIYETSSSLREKQRALVGEGATVTEGDARHPGATLGRDFPDGLRGFVLTNEVPDAFGVHKVVLSVDGDPSAVLVVPRAEASLREALDQIDQSLARRISDTDTRLRDTFDLRENAGDFYLDGATFAQVMEAIAGVEPDRRGALRAWLWFEEALVPASIIPELAAHLRANSPQYATALAAEDSGVVAYVNVHAGRFIRELGASLRAGVIITIDYGDATWGLIRGARRGDLRFRVYGAWEDYQPRPNDPYAAPGTQDLTTDVNFTELAAAGRGAGLHVIHYGREADLIGDELPEALRAAAEDDAVAEFLGSPVFKVLVLGVRASTLFAGPLTSALPLEHSERDLPKARRDKIPAMQRRLSSETE